MVVRTCSYQEKEDIIGFGKEASGCRLFYQLYGVQGVGGSNPLTPTLKGYTGPKMNSLARQDGFTLAFPREVTCS